ncbi:MAG: murein biosynthesis integral membrane protein MurJ [Acidimicrobiia bacterium]
MSARVEPASATLPADDGWNQREETTQTVGVAGWTLVSRLTGLVRIAVAGATLGPTFFANIFQITNTLPNLTYNLFAGSLVPALVVPSLVAALDREGAAGARRLCRSLVGVVLLGFGAASALVICSGPVIVRLVTAGISDSASSAQAQRQTWVLLLLVVPQIMLYGVAAIGVAAQNARRRFALAAAAPAVENVGLVVTLLVAAAWFGGGLRTGDVTGAHLLVLGIGSTLSVAAHAGIQLFGAARVGLPLWPTWSRRDQAVREVIRRGIPTLADATVQAGSTFAVVLAAGTVPGGVVAMQIGLKLYNLPLALSARAVGTVLMPKLAQLRVRGSPEGFRATYLRGLSMSWLVAVPAAVALVFLARPIAELLAFGELDRDGAITLVAVSVASLGLALVGTATYEIARQACYARLDARSPLLGGIAQAVVVLAGVGASVLVFDGTAALAVLGLAVTLGSLVRAVVVDRAARSGIAGLEGRARRILGLDFVASVVAVGPAALLVRVVASAVDGRAGLVVGLALGAVVGMVGYAAALAVLVALRAPDLPDLRRGETQRLAPTTTSSGGAP